MSDADETLIKILPKLRWLWLTNQEFSVKYRLHAEVAELADALRSGRSSLHGSVGSTPTFGTEPLVSRGFARNCVVCLIPLQMNT